MNRSSRLASVAALLCALPALAETLPNAWLYSARPLDAVPGRTLPALDLDRLALEDSLRERDELPPRYALPVEVAVDPRHDGLWESVDAETSLWRYRVRAPGAYSLNLGFTRFRLPADAQLLVYSPDALELRGPFTAGDNEAHGELWVPLLLTDDLVVELTVPTARRGEVELRLGRIGHGYRGFGAAHESMLSGACNMDVECLAAADPWRDPVRASAVISTGGSTFCSGSLLNNTAQDKKPLFMTANHCGIGPGNAASLVTFWNYQNSTCRVPGSAPSGGPGDGSLAQFNTGSIHRASSAASDFTLVELDDPINPAFDLWWGGWNRSSSEASCGEATLCAGIHHPNTDEKRITFSDRPTITSSWGGTPPPQPGDGSHIWVHWDDDPPYFPSPPGVTEGGSSGSPFYDPNRRFIGQLHGGASACGATGDNLSDIYGRLSVSWNGGGTPSTRVSDWLDPLATGVVVLDGRAECTPPAAPAALTAAPNGDNRIDLDWSPVGGADSYRVYRSTGSCPGASWTLIAQDVVPSAYSDLDVLGGETYAYRVSAFVASEACESQLSNCDDATATGSCPTPGATTLVAPVDGTSGHPRRPQFEWTDVALADDYDLEVDDDATFTSPVYTATVAATTHTPGSDLPEGTLLYWRVRTTNVCGTGALSETHRFVSTEPNAICRTPNLPIPDNQPAGVNDQLVVAAGGAISDLDVALVVSHTWVGDLRVTLSNGGAPAELYDRPGVPASTFGCSGDDVDVVIDDEGADGNVESQCADLPATFGDRVGGDPPNSAALAVFDGQPLADTWVLNVSDNAGADLGTLEEWCLLTPNPMPFLDSFETDDTGRWSSTVP